MPGFHKIGFILPLLFALIYVWRAIPCLNTHAMVYFLLSALLTYLMPIWHPTGVGFIPFYIVVMFIFIGFTNRNVWWSPPFVPFAALLPLSFLSVSIPDFLRTLEGGGSQWQVGGAGWQDGLIKYWLWMLPVFILTWSWYDWTIAKGANKPFSMQKWVALHLSPLRGDIPT